MGKSVSTSNGKFLTMIPTSHLWWERLGDGLIASATTIANAVKMEKDWFYRPTIHLRRNNVFSGIKFKFV